MKNKMISPVMQDIFHAETPYPYRGSNFKLVFLSKGSAYSGNNLEIKLVNLVNGATMATATSWDGMKGHDDKLWEFRTLGTNTGVSLTIVQVMERFSQITSDFDNFNATY